jgi:transcriptional regulator GlxA family with amidase domain
MKIAIIIFDGITWLDMIGVYDPLTRLRSMNFLPDMELDICSLSETAKDSFGLEVISYKVGNSLAHYDAIIVPGGMGTRGLQKNKKFIDWIKTAAGVKFKISVCTGSLILGAAGFLKDKNATTNYLEYETLKPYCKKVVNKRIVEDQDVITAGAVASSIDLGLYLCEKWAGKRAKNQIKKRMAFNG